MLTPLYLERDDHVTGLIRLLTIALGGLTTRRALPSLYAGHPAHATARPTAELLLATFKEITLTRVRTPHFTLRHLTALSHTQRDILGLLGLAPDAYAPIDRYLLQPP